MERFNYPSLQRDFNAKKRSLLPEENSIESEQRKSRRIENDLYTFKDLTKSAKEANAKKRENTLTEDDPIPQKIRVFEKSTRKRPAGEDQN